MLGLAALLLAASGGYYAYANWVKTTRDDFTHAVERPEFTISPARSEAPLAAADATATPTAGATRVDVAAANGDGPARQSSASLLAPIGYVAAPGVNVRALSGVTGAESSALRGAGDHPQLRALFERTSDSPATVARESAASGDAEEGNSLAGVVDGRMGAAIAQLTVRQARRGLDDPDYAPAYEEVDAMGLDAEAERVAAPAPSVAPRSQEPTGRRAQTLTTEQLIATRAETVDSRAAIVTPRAAFAETIAIEGIGLNSTVKELVVEVDGGSRAWETPAHIVGHIPTTASPGERGQGWYFGHLESPLQGEGNVFRRLPELASRFKRGERFSIILEAGDLRYVYQVYRTEVVPATEFAITDSGLNDITLVSCWPQYVYSERVLVTAALVEVTEAPGGAGSVARARGS